MSLPQQLPNTLRVIFPTVDLTAPITTTRIAARVVIMVNQKLLLLQSRHRDLKLPGGGLEPQESPAAAASRELTEETGLTAQIAEQILVVDELSPEPGGSFQMMSYYFRAQLNSGQKAAQLSASEQELGLNPIWLSISDALTQNLSVAQQAADNPVLAAQLPWLRREIAVLRWLAP